MNLAGWANWRHARLPETHHLPGTDRNGQIQFTDGDHRDDYEPFSEVCSDTDLIATVLGGLRTSGPKRDHSIRVGDPLSGIEGVSVLDHPVDEHSDTRLYTLRVDQVDQVLF